MLIFFSPSGVHACANILSCSFYIPPKQNDKAILHQINQLLPSGIQIFDLIRVPSHFEPRTFCVARTYEYFIPLIAFKPSDRNPNYTEEQRNHWKFSNKDFDRINEIMQLLIGTKLYFNYTTASKAQMDDPTLLRSIFQFQAVNIVTIGDHQFLRCSITGRSFLYNQIRKMIGSFLFFFGPFYYLPFSQRIIHDRTSNCYDQGRCPTGCCSSHI